MLQDLILEKLGLIKEVNRMKQLNGHLETRLEEQERRLCMVTNELSKTWHVVGRLRRHHHQLHTHEKILKYELQQKRKLLNELKEELEYCREKWEQAREKNTQSEKDWRDLRAEFSSRKNKPGSPSFNNSGESGYSDERPSDESSESNDESEYIAEPTIRCKRKLKKSFETILDSSTDLNLPGEREEPVSDLLDVADLPLDTQESEGNHELMSEPSKSDNLLKPKKGYEETEDEMADITHDDSCPEEIHTEQELIKDVDNTLRTSTRENIEVTTQSDASESPSTSGLIDPSQILKNIQLQNERLAKKDAKLNSLEKESIALLKKTQATVEISEQINNTLDHLIKRPTPRDFSPDNVSQHAKYHNESIEDQKPFTENLALEDIAGTSDEKETVDITEKIEFETSQISEAPKSPQVVCLDEMPITTSDDTTNSNQKNYLPGVSQSTPDFQAILENVRKQNERLAKKDERLEKLESSCSEVVETLVNTLDSGEKIIEKLDSLHTDHQSKINDTALTVDTTMEDNSDKEDSGPSTSSEIDHEARFAARDLRLKRLEEQTKSLVNRVNKTTSKGVKIHYKLEELHNIYGSESSRAGTPSEENEDKSNGSESPDEQ